MPSVLLALLGVFVPLSLVTIGGGQSAVADIHRQVVEVHQWMTQAQFVDAFAISRMSPGPGSLLVTLIGWQVAGVAGAVVATIGIFVPPAFVIYGMARLWSRYQGARWLVAIERGLRPVAAGMILAAVYVLLLALDGGWIAQAVAAAATVAMLFTRISPLVLVALGAAVFVALHLAGLIPADLAI